MKHDQRRSSRQRYLEFVSDYKAGRVDESEGRANGAQPAKAGRRDRGKRKEQLREYLRWLRPHRHAVAAVVLLALVAAGLEMVQPLFMRFILDKVLLNTRLDARSRLSRLQLAGAAYLAVAMLANFTGAVRDYRQRLLNTSVVVALQRSLFKRLLHLPLSRLWDMKTGGILARLTGDVEMTTGLLQMAVVSPVVSSIRLLISIVVLFSLNWRLALTATAVIPGVVLTSMAIARRVRPIYRSARKDAEAIDGRVGETFSGIRIVRAFRGEVVELLNYARGRHDVLRKELFAHRRQLMLWTSWSLLLSGVNVGILWYGGYLNITGGTSIGDIVAFQWYTMMLLNPVWQIVNSFSELQRALAAMERVFDVMTSEPDKPDRPAACAAPSRVQEIRFEHVEFEYRPDRPVVHDFDLVVPGGSVVALVGRSGAGKTTVTDLVARYHDPTRGRILVNGLDIRDFRMRSYRDLLAIVQQEVFLFDGSVRDNIAYGRHDATDADVEDAARRANAHDFIMKLPEGYATFVGERGVKLSGGQCQRLAIARAVLAAPQILILDEATSNLDTESEQLIQDSMVTLLAGRTTFIIAHRLSTIRRADIILVMEDGRVTERGTHEELMDAHGGYHEMVRRQTAAAGQSGEAVW